MDGEMISRRHGVVEAECRTLPEMGPDGVESEHTLLCDNPPSESIRLPPASDNRQDYQERARKHADYICAPCVVHVHF